MIKILSNFILSIVVFFFLTFSSYALKLEENNTYSGTIKDNHRNNIPLPPGEWLLTEIKDKKIKGKRVTSGTVDYSFYNSEIGYVYYSGPTGTNVAPDYWVGRKTPTVCQGNPIAGKTNISGKNNTEWCTWDDGDYINFVNYTALHFKQYYHSYSINKSLLRDTSKSTMQSIGSQIYDQVRKNKAGDLSFLTSRLDFNKSTSTTTNEFSFESDISGNTEIPIAVNKKDYKIICNLLKCEKFREGGDSFTYYLREFLDSGEGYEYPYLAVSKNDIGSKRGVAWQMDVSRSAALRNCAEYSDDCIVIIEDGFITNEYFKNFFLNMQSTEQGTFEFTEKQNVNDTSSIASKLRELKSLLDEGLISQDQYDEKSSKILKDL